MKTVEERFIFLKEEKKRIETELESLRPLVLAGVSDGSIRSFRVSRSARIKLIRPEMFVKGCEFFGIDVSELLKTEIVLDKNRFLSRCIEKKVDYKKISGLEISESEALCSRKERDSGDVLGKIKELFEIK